jgi:predicted amidohydrolase
MSRALVAALQLTSTSDEAANRAQIETLAAEAAAAGATLVTTPENATFLGPHDEKVRRAESIDGPTVRWAGGLARKLGVELVLGSFAERWEESAGQRCWNTCVVLARSGEVVARYRKIHLFDVDYPPHVVFRESDTVGSGSEAVVAPSSVGRLGLAICYDLRFPELFVSLVERGAEVLVLPAAFTAPTGRAHWEVLVRARAIESQCYVIAPAQVGRHDDGGLRESFGHSMIVDPWGEVLAVRAEDPGVVLAEVDVERVRGVRARLPIREHRAGRAWQDCRPAGLLQYSEPSGYFDEPSRE